MYQEILYALAFVILSISSYCDIKKREVPDLISYGLILTAISLRAVFAAYLYDASVIINGLIGLGVMVVFAFAMFYSGQWGGGDAKLLMALGAVFGLSYDIQFQPLLLFLANLLLFGSIYGLAWTSFLFVRSWPKSRHEFVSVLSSKKAMVIRIPLYALSVFFFVYAVFVPQTRKLSLLLAIMLPFMFFLWAYTKVVENVSMLKRVLPPQLTEGDWIAENIVVDNNKICGPKDLGLSQRQLKELNALYSKGKIKTVLIKEGIPFVPSFLLAFIATLVLEGWLVLFF